MNAATAARAKSSSLKTVLIIAAIAVAVLFGAGVILGIAVFQYKSSQRIEREAAVIQSLETLRKAQAVFALQNQRQYGTFDQLLKSGSLEDARFSGDTPIVNGYVFTMQVTPSRPGRAAFYSINADPLDASGRHFYLDPEVTAIRVNDFQPASATDPPITK